MMAAIYLVTRVAEKHVSTLNYYPLISVDMI